MAGAGRALVEVRGLKKHFSVGGGFLQRKKTVRAVDGVSFDVIEGETLGVVGESGCGKSTMGRTMLQLYPPTEGSVSYRGVDLAGLSRQELLPYRKKIQIIFQDPYSSLNPRQTIGSIVCEPLTLHRKDIGKKERLELGRELLRKVNLDQSFVNRFPHEFSGGQRQRIGIARALAVKPEFIVCDEPISALDVSVQAQVVTLLEDLQGEFGLTYLFIAHDLSMVRHISTRIAVMYLGRIVELAGRDELFRAPLHPYTRALLAAIPVPDPEYAARNPIKTLEGEIPSALNPPRGCCFHPRCPMAGPACEEGEPAFRELGPGHYCACHKA
ncbi:MAG TPA: ATP-binding cassette domain-containing protein [Spirochaetales bacterium]|nr:ATP-binding cassette domain-containing protein [Spirochaetales bacterium]HRY53511.1 ATP-binding cassette domain-containing protein [Spirochaetia bacterium]HRZ63805.1 ATP-binding cassette domain-containing protein [Spirochaetia bacterium]